MLGVVVVVLVAAADAESPTTSAIVSTMRDGLTDALVMVHTAEATDENAAAVSAQVHADAVVAVTWPSPDRARVRVRIVRDGHWEEREIAFSPSDAPTQRGRALGLATVTLIPPDAPAPAVVPEPPPAPRALPAPPIPPPPPRWMLALDAGLIGAVGLGGRANALGGELALHVLPARVAARSGARILGGVRFGELEDARITTSTARFGVGLGLDVARAARISVRLSLDGLVIRHGFARAALDGTTETRTRWLAGVGLAVEGELDLGGGFRLVAAPGLELALGSTRVVVGAEDVTIVPRARGIGWIGVRVRL